MLWACWRTFLHSERTEWGLAQCLLITTHARVIMQLIILALQRAGIKFFFFFPLTEMPNLSSEKWS